MIPAVHLLSKVRNMKKLGILLAILWMGTGLLQIIWHLEQEPAQPEPVSAEKVNLALRRTAHLLLQEAGDSSSQIPPVKRLNLEVWSLRLTQQFKYERLPVLLESSLNLHKINRRYDVVLRNCNDGTLILGYNAEDVTTAQNTPCSGRDMQKECYDIELRLLPGTRPTVPLPLMAWLLVGLLAAPLYYAGKKRLDKNAEESSENHSGAMDAANNPAHEGIHFANSWLDVANQTLRCGETYHKLTYRETKLLHLFVLQTNQVLERGYILDKVWADEGIVVGRSLDMFVSRLRKLLREDPDVQIVAIHGVGYKMEVATR